jgi:malonyl-CoA O-methyltransferase
MVRLSAAQAMPSAHAARRAFERASGTFAAACPVHDEARRRLLARLPWMRIEPRTVVDLGCALGAGARGLAAVYPTARVIAVDSSPAMLAAAAAAVTGGGALRPVDYLLADAVQLGLASASVDLIFANLLLPWCRPDAVFREAARVLTQGGLFLFATLGPDTLQEVRRAWASTDDSIHVHGFYDMHDLGDLLASQGLLEPVMDVDRIQVTYPDVASLVTDLRACGATNTADGRRRTLTGPRRWAAFEQTLLAARQAGRISLTVELILGQAWGSGKPGSPAGGEQEYSVPVDRIRRRRGV